MVQLGWNIRSRTWTPPGSGQPNALTGNCATHPVYAYNGLGYWDPDTNNVGGSVRCPYVNWFTVNIAFTLSGADNLY